MTDEVSIGDVWIRAYRSGWECGIEAMRMSMPSRRGVAGGCDERDICEAEGYNDCLEDVAKVLERLAPNGLRASKEDPS